MNGAMDPWDPNWPDEEPQDQWFPDPDEGWEIDSTLEDLPPELGAAVGGALGWSAEEEEDGAVQDGGAPVPGLDPEVSRGAAEALARRAAERARHDEEGDGEDEEDPYEGLVRPQGIVPTSAMSGFRLLGKLSPKRQALLLAVVVVFGAAILIGAQYRHDARPWWSAKVNLVSTVNEVNKMTLLKLPLGEATAKQLTRAHRLRAEARKAGARDARYLDAEDVRYVGEDVESSRGSVSVFASDDLWAAASREGNGECLWALVATSGWAELYRAGDTPTCTAADAVRGAPKVVELYRRQQQARTTSTTAKG